MTRVEYHENVTVNPDSSLTGNDLLVAEDHVYTENADGFAIYRDITVTWYREDGSAGPETKTLRKYYTVIESRTEGRKRRRNVIDTISMNVVGWLMATQTAGDQGAAVALGTPFMANLSTETNNYIELSDGSLATAITDDTTTAWLDNLIAPGVTIRAGLLAEL